MAEDYPSRELFTSKEIEKHFNRKRRTQREKLLEAEAMLSHLNRMLIAGTITGLQLVKEERKLNEIITKAKNALRMQSVSENVAQIQRKKEGSAFV